MHGFWILAGLIAALPMQEYGSIESQFETSDDVHKHLGYQPAGWVQRGELAAGGKLRLPVELSGGTAYALRGACDEICDDIDLELTDAAGRVVESDTQSDATPMVDADKSGSYVLLVTMNSCKVEKCAFAVKAYRK